MEKMEEEQAIAVYMIISQPETWVDFGFGWESVTYKDVIQMSGVWVYTT